MDASPYRLTNSLLQVTFSPATYRMLLAKYRRGQITPRFSKYLAGSDYWDAVPTYLVARCPFCAASYTAKLDTHSLYDWHTHPEIDRGVYHEQYQNIGCTHFVGVHTFISLRGELPDELPYYRSYYDVPFVTPTLLPPNESALAVLHSLPICRLEHEQFVPRYALYTLTYYARDPQDIRARRRAEHEATRPDNPPASYRAHLWYTNAEVKAHPESFALAQWVQRGKLQWLDLTTPDLPLQAGPLDAFPYTGIRGYRRAFTYREGVLVVEQ